MSYGSEVDSAKEKTFSKSGSSISQSSIPDPDSEDPEADSSFYSVTVPHIGSFYADSTDRLLLKFLCTSFYYKS